MNLLLVISSLAAGGAERVLSILANFWAAKGWRVTLITLDMPTSDFYPLDRRIRRVGLGLMGESPSLGMALKQNLKRLMKLRQAIKEAKPDAVISFVETVNVLTLISTLGLGLRVIVSERTEPRSHDPGQMWRWLRRLTYPWASAIVAQSDSVGQWLRGLAGKHPLVTIIPNPINPEVLDLGGLKGKAFARPRERRLVTSLGRLSWEKGYDLLLRAFAPVSAAHPEWDLMIIGDGVERENLSQLTAELGISDRVHFPGKVENPLILLSQADLFVLPSCYEGFPNALLEAMACGVAVISFDCPSGPREIIREGVNGLLIPPRDIAALAAAMGRLMGDEDERRRLAARAPEVKERFSLEKVASRWEALLCRPRG